MQVQPILLNYQLRKSFINVSARVFLYKTIICLEMSLMSEHMRVESNSTQESKIFRGTVFSFNFHEGLGSVVDEKNNVYDFHCTAIADGSRNISIGESVSFCLQPAMNGIWEATSITVSQPR